MDHAAKVPQYLGRDAGQFRIFVRLFRIRQLAPGLSGTAAEDVHLEERLCGYAPLPGWRGGHDFAGGYISDWLVRKGARVTVARKVLACSGLCLATVFTLLGAYSTSTWPAVTFLTLAVASFSLATGSIQTMMVDIAPPHFVASLGSLQNFLGNIGGALAPLVTGILLARTKSFTVPLIVTACVALFAAACYGFIVGNLDERLKERTKGAATV